MYRRIGLGLTAVLVTGFVGLVDFGGAAAAPPATIDFSEVFNENANGAIITIGNTLLTCPETPGTAAAEYCPKAHAGTSIMDNNDFRMIQLDADSDPATTKNSSSSDLILPAGASVLWAHLYWGARLAAGTQGVAGDASLASQMKFKLPGAAAYSDIAGTVIALNSGQKNAYQAVADVTGIIQALANPNGTYWGGDVETGTGLDRYAGWALTVVYSAPGLPLRNLTVFEGFKTVGSGYPADVKVEGFLAPKTGLVDAQLTMVAYEGDLAQTGDYTLLSSDTSKSSTQLATPVSPGSNFFDSVNSLAGASVATRDPAYKNMLGFDIKNLGVSGAIGNGAKEATFNFRSAGDVYYPGVLGLAINLYAPDFTSSTKTAVNVTHPNQPAFPGDTLQYTVMFANSGQDNAVGAVACDALPADEVDYVPGSIVLLGTADPDVGTPVGIPDDGSSYGQYDAASRTLCMNLGKGAVKPYQAGRSGGGRIDVLEATVYQFQVRVKDEAGGKTVSNIVNLQYTTDTTEISAVYDPPPAVTPVGVMADVKIAKTIVGGAVIAGHPFQTRLTVDNINGPSGAKGVTVTDPLPAGFTATQAVWASVPAARAGTCPLPAAGGTLTCDLGDMAHGETIAITLTGAVDSASLATSLSNVASVATDSYDPDMSNNIATASVPMTHQADLKIEKTPKTSTAVPGSEITWTLKVTNKCAAPAAPDGADCLSDATGVVITDTVPEPTKLILESAVGGDGTGGDEGDVPVDCTGTLASAASLQCQVNTSDAGRLKPGQTAVVTVKAYLTGNVTAADGAIKNNAAVTSATFDPDQADNLDTATVVAGSPVSDIQLVKKASAASAVPGRHLDYTITAENFGPSDASDVVITDAFPAGLTADGQT
ncbi:MAG: DUF11 domain-containing protein, partial [Bifidobacteriaceae bacterium]|nr:DUF11 domain-containing protein [Bifidobacteriaceae bacterium]